MGPPLRTVVDHSLTSSRLGIMPIPKTSSNNDGKDQVKVSLRVEGMMCQKSCASTVREALLSIPGCLSATASFSSSSASVVVNVSDFCLAMKISNEESSSIGKVIEDYAVTVIQGVGFDASILDANNEISLHVDDENTAVIHDPTSSFLRKSSAGEESDEDHEVELTLRPALTLQVGGMSCAACTGRVEKALRHLPFVDDVKVNFATGRAQVHLAVCDDHDSLLNNQSYIEEQCVKNIQAAGYDCAALNIDNLSANVIAVRDVRDKEISSWRRLLIIACTFSSPLIFYHWISMMNKQHMHSMYRDKLGWDEWVGLALSTPVQCLVGYRYYRSAYASIKAGSLGMDFLIIMGSTASYLYSLVLFFMGLFSRFNQDATRPKAPFETSAMLLTFVTIGKFLEAYAKGKMASALQSLLELQDKTAFRCVSTDFLAKNDKQNDISSLDGVEIKLLVTEEVDTNTLRVGDFLVVKPGGRIPTDGIIVATGNTGKKIYIDESALTGETFPVAKGVGEEVYGATLNQSSCLLIRVTAVGSATVIGSILRLVEQAQCNRAPIQSIADQISSIFAPCVLFISSVTFLGWLFFNNKVDIQERVFTAIMNAISVIVVACPCALGLATPTAVMVGTGVGASNGLLIKGGAVLEVTHLVDTIVFDKTGTLTSGHASVVSRKEYLSDAGEDNPILKYIPKSIQISDAALWFAGCVELASDHPIAKAIVNSANNLFGNGFASLSDDMKIINTSIIPGEGIEGVFSNGETGLLEIRIGTTAFATFDHSCNTSLVEKDIVIYRNLGYTAVLAGFRSSGNPAICQINDQVRIIGTFGIYDTPKPEAKSTVSALKKMGMDVWLCTGDHYITATSLAKEVGIDEEKVRAEVRPDGKAALVTELENTKKDVKCCTGTEQYRRVAFVGDGVNDSVALSEASVGIALGSGTAIAIDAADIILTSSNLHDVYVAVHLSRVVFNRIMLNFFWATAYNIFSIPLATGIFSSLTLPPAVAGMMMPFSSISVVLSSLLLKYYKKPTIDEAGQITRRDGCLKCLSQMKFRFSRYQGFSPVDNTSMGDLELV